MGWYIDWWIDKSIDWWTIDGSVISMCDEKENQDSNKIKKKKASIIVQTLPDVSILPPMKKKKKEWDGGVGIGVY